MPKEITHWTLAEKIYQRLPSGPLKESISAHKNLYFLGSTILDAPMYALLEGKKGKRVRAEGCRFHNQNPYHYLCSFIKAYMERKKSEALLPFLAGILTHMIADSVYHPMIHYFCGDLSEEEWGEESRTRHYLFESYLDLHYLQDNSLHNNESFSQTFKECEVSETELIIMVEYLFRETLSHQDTKRVLEKYCLLQGLFRKGWFYQFVSLLNRVSGNKLSSYVALIYPKYYHYDIPFFQKEIIYKHPVTGKTEHDTIATFEEKVMSRYIDLFQKIDEGDLLALQTELERKGDEALSLNTGLTLDKSQKISFCDKSRSIENLLGIC